MIWNKKYKFLEKKKKKKKSRKYSDKKKRINIRFENLYLFINIKIHLYQSKRKNYWIEFGLSDVHNSFFKTLSFAVSSVLQFSCIGYDFR